MTEGSGGDGRIGIGMVGHAFMGAVHSHAWRTAHRFFDLPMVPHLAVLGGRDLARTKAAASRYGLASVSTDWHEVATERESCDALRCTVIDAHERLIDADGRNAAEFQGVVEGLQQAKNKTSTAPRATDNRA